MQVPGPKKIAKNELKATFQTEKLFFITKMMFFNKSIYENEKSEGRRCVFATPGGMIRKVLLDKEVLLDRKVGVLSAKGSIFAAC